MYTQSEWNTCFYTFWQQVVRCWIEVRSLFFCCEGRGFNVEGEGSRSRIEVACKQAFPCSFGAKNQRKNKERESETAREMELTASPETALISYAQGRYRIVRPLKYGKETEQLIFKF